MHITRNAARQTTLMYLLMGLPAVPALMYLPPGELSILSWLIVKSITLKQTEARLAYAR